MNRTLLYFRDSKLFKSTMIFTLANIIDKGLPFLILPFLTHAMPPEHFALIALFTGIFVVTNYSVGLSASGFLGIAYFKNDSVGFHQIVYNSALVFLLSFVLNLLVIAAAPSFFSEKSGLNAEYLMLSVVASLGIGFHSMILSIYRSKMQAVPYGILQVLRSLLDIGISLILVISYNLSWMGRIWGITAANILMGGVALVLIYKKNWIEFKFSPKHFKALLFFGIPLFPHAVANWALSMADRFFINHFVGSNENGKYALGFTLGMALAVFTQSFNQAWAPYLYEILKQNSLLQKRNAVKVTYIYFFLILLVALIFSYFAKLILNTFFPAQYSEAIVYIMPISISYAFDGMYMMVTNYILYSGKTYLLSMATGSVAVIKLILSYYLIKNYGSQGAIYSSLIGFFLLFIFTYILAAKVEPMPWNLFRKNSELQ